MESLVCSRTRRVEDDHPQAGVIPSLFAASVWCSNDDVHPAYPYPLVLALPVPNHHDQEEIRKLSVCSTTTTVEYHPQAAVNPPLSAASVWCFNDDVHPYPYPLVLALPVPSHHHHQEEITKLTLFTGSQQVDHSTAQSLFPCAPRIEDHLPIKKRKRFFIIVGSKKPENNSIQVGHPNTLSAPTIKDHLPINNHHLRDNLGSLAELIHAASSLSLSLFPPTKKINIGPKKPNKNHHWDNELIDAASSLSLSLPTKRKRLINIGPKKPQNNSIQVEEEGVIIAKKQKVVVDKTSPRNHHHWIHKRLSKSDVNLSSRLLLPKEEITKYVLPLMNMESCRACQNKNGLRVKIWDLDTESEHELSLKQWVTGSFLLTSNWNKEFVKRRSLHEGDTISMCWDFENLSCAGCLGGGEEGADDCVSSGILVEFEGKGFLRVFLKLMMKMTSNGNGRKVVEMINIWREGILQSFSGVDDEDDKFGEKEFLRVFLKLMMKMSNGNDEDEIGVESYGVKKIKDDEIGVEEGWRK
nr:putative B3 domain-containing protein At1g78640 [Ipomoea batatas]